MIDLKAMKYKDRRARPRGPEAEFDYFKGLLETRKVEIGGLDPASLVDARKHVIGTIVLRQGQKEFRDTLLDAYGRKCAVSNYDVVQALEAAHIVPYRGTHTNAPSNGILLRSDLHTLFDYGLIAVDSSNMKLIINDKLGDTSYSSLAGSQLHVPDNSDLRPAEKLLNMHREWASL